MNPKRVSLNHIINGCVDVVAHGALLGLFDVVPDVGMGLMGSLICPCLVFTLPKMTA